jgi:hypothetical protein
MKNKYNIIFIIVVIFASLYACNKDETKVVISSSPVPPSFISPTNGANLTLNSEQSLDSLYFIWSSANYGFQASVQYRIQIDTTTNFYTAKMLNTSYSDTFIVLQKTLNTLLVSNLKLVTNARASIFLRIRAITYAGYDTIYSSPINMKVTPF